MARGITMEMRNCRLHALELGAFMLVAAHSVVQAQDAALGDPDRPDPDHRDPKRGEPSATQGSQVEQLLAPEDLTIPQVVVTDSRLQQTRDEAPSDSLPSGHAALAVDVIDRREIQQSGARDAAELLEERAGLQVSRSFRGTELWLRGMDPQYTLVLVDGDRVPGRIGGAIDLSRYGVENISRVEIIRGPSSALYGSDAIGGVVNLVTRGVERDLEAEGMVSYGMNDVVDVTGRVAGRPTKRVSLRLDGGFHQADAIQGTDDDQDVATITGSSRSLWTLGGRGDWIANRHQRIRLTADYLRLTLQGVDRGGGGAVFDRTQLQEQVRVSLENRAGDREGLSLVTRATYNQFRSQYLSDQRGSNQLDTYEENREHLGQVTTLLNAPVRGLGEHDITVGFEVLSQSLDADRLAQYGSRSRYSLLGQDEWIPWKDAKSSLRIVPGLRYDVDTQFGSQVSPKLALRLDVQERWALRASYGRGFRAPSFQQLLLRFENPTVGYAVRGNPNLDAETSHGVDVGAEWKPREEVSLSVGFFRNDLENMIAVVTTEDTDARGTLFSYSNLETAWTMGLETAASLRVDDLLGFVAGYTLTETWDGENNRPLEGRARHRVTLATRLAHAGSDLSLVLRGALMIDRVFFVDSDGDGMEEELYADPFTQVDLRVAKRFTRHLELFAGVDNLLDAGDVYTVIRPLTVYAGARARY